MPSFRVTVDIRDVRPGVRPEDVLPAAERILAATHLVEDRLLDVAGLSSGRPQPQVHLRFLVPPTEAQAEVAEAHAVVERLVAELDEVAECGRWVLCRGPGRRWRVIAVGGRFSAS